MLHTRGVNVMRLPTGIKEQGVITGWGSNDAPRGCLQKVELRHYPTPVMIIKPPTTGTGSEEALNS
jgi:hypothetical protein